MSKLGSLIGMIGAGVAGYGSGVQVRRKNEREDRIDAQQQEGYEYEKAQREKQTKLDSDLAASQADQAVEDVTPPDMSNADISMAGPRTPQYRANGVMYGDRAAAEQALVGANSMAAKNQRAADVMRQAGQIEKAQVYDALAKRALDEGTDRVISSIQAARPSIDQIKAAGGMVAGAVGQDAAEVFNKQGGRWKVGADTVVQHYLTKDAAGRDIVASRVLGKDGKPVIDDVDHAGLFLQDYKTRMEAQSNDTKTFQAGQQLAQGDKRIAEEVRSNQAREAEQRRGNDNQYRVGMAGVGVQMGRLAIDQAKDRREAELFKNQTVDGQIEQIEKALGPMSEDDKKGYRRSLLKIGTKDGAKSTDALVDKLVEKFGETNTDPAAIAGFRADLQNKFEAVGSNRKVEAALKTEFVKNPFGSDGYAQTYNDAKTQLKLSDADLQQMGYKAPPAAGAARAARGVTPAPPTEKAWIGNTYQTTPEYAAWDAKYGAAARAASNSGQRRAISALERPHD